MVLHVTPTKKDEIMASLVDEWVSQGEAKFLTGLLEHHFGSLSQKAKEKIASANTDTLELWGKRILEASSLDDIFKDKNQT
jgi:hypothetical protein